MMVRRNFGLLDGKVQGQASFSHNGWYVALSNGNKKRVFFEVAKEQWEKDVSLSVWMLTFLWFSISVGFIFPKGMITRQHAIATVAFLGLCWLVVHGITFAPTIWKYFH